MAVKHELTGQLLILLIIAYELRLRFLVLCNKSLVPLGVGATVIDDKRHENPTENSSMSYHRPTSRGPRPLQLPGVLDEIPSGMRSAPQQESGP